jgi:hypothetical protein
MGLLNDELLILCWYFPYKVLGRFKEFAVDIKKMNDRIEKVK